MKYKDADFFGWLSVPTEAVFNDWVAMRKGKRAATTQTGLNRAAKWINLLEGQGYTADISLGIACENGWQGLEHVYNLEARKGFPEGRKRAQYRENVISLPRGNPIKEQLNNRNGVNDLWIDEQ